MLQALYYVLYIPLALYTVYFVALGAFALRRRSGAIPAQAARHRLAVLIPARNESAVIGKLVASLFAQQYPRELFDVYVLPNNCTDDTAAQALKAGARILPIVGTTRTKGEVLRQAFPQLTGSYDALIIFDADNLVQADFLQRMNDALCAGFEVAQGCRDSKNPLDNWVSGVSSIYFWVINSFMNHARMNIGLSATINGTGFMIKSTLLQAHGYDMKTISEDMELTIHCALHKKRIAYVQDAVFYDEQPTDFGTSQRQRRRWVAGAYQCLWGYWRLLLRGALRDRSMACVDMLLVTIAPLVQISYLVIAAVVLVYYFASVDIVSYARLFLSFYDIAQVAMGLVIQVALAQVAVLLAGKKALPYAISALLFPVFIWSWLPLNIGCLFASNIQWEPIAHKRALNLPGIARQKE